MRTPIATSRLRISVSAAISLQALTSPSQTALTTSRNATSNA